MKIFVETLPEFLGALGSAAIISTLAWYTGRRHRNRRPAPPFEQPPRPKPGTHHQVTRRYTLLGTTDRQGTPIQVTSTRPAGAVLLWQSGTRQERFELTDAPLHDGTFAAEPVARFEETD